MVLIGSTSQFVDLRLPFPTYRNPSEIGPCAFHAGERIATHAPMKSTDLFASSRYQIALAACLVNQLESNANPDKKTEQTSLIARSGTHLINAWSGNLHSRICRSLAERWSVCVSNQTLRDLEMNNLNVLYTGSETPDSVRIAAWVALLAHRAGLTSVSRRQMIFAGLCHRLGHPIDRQIHLAEAQRLTLAILTANKPIPELVHGTILHCRERLDGLGQPYGIDGKRIPVGAQLLGLAIDLDEYLSSLKNLRGLETSLTEFLRSMSNRYDTRWLDMLAQTMDSDNLAPRIRTTP